MRPSLVIPKYHYSLEQRVKAAERGGAPVTRTAPAFVEVVPAAVGPVGVTECVIDFADARGATMRITLKSPADLAALSQGFWRSRA